MSAIAQMDAVVLPEMDFSNRTSSSSIFGLVTLRGAFSEIGEASSITVRVNDLTATFAADQCVRHVSETGRIVLVNLMTHLMPDGPAKISMDMKLVDGRTVSFPPKSINIANTTPLARHVAEDLRRHGTPPILPRIIDSSMFPYQDGQTKAWFDEINPTDVLLSFEQSHDIEGAHRHLERWGFCILPERLTDDLIDGFKAQLDEAIADGRLPFEHGSSQRILNAHRLEYGRQIWLYPPVMRFLERHFRDEPCACQTLTYVNGSQQDAHQDTIHLTPYPAGFMCGVWIALEDVQPMSGELFVYPGSHRSPRLRAGELGLEKVDEDYSSYAVFDQEVQQLMREGGFERASYQPKAGQILVWHENLVHGGSPRADLSRTRKSIVSHYFSKGAVAYYDSRGEAAALESLQGLA